MKQSVKFLPPTTRLLPLCADNSRSQELGNEQDDKPVVANPAKAEKVREAVAEGKGRGRGRGRGRGTGRGRENPSAKTLATKKVQMAAVNLFSRSLKSDSSEVRILGQFSESVVPCFLGLSARKIQVKTTFLTIRMTFETESTMESCLLIILLRIAHSLRTD